MTENKFLKDLKTYFPELHDLYLLSKEDKKILQVLKILAEFNKLSHYGKVEIGYQNGVINHVLKTISVK
jgi:hypothetical protein